MTDRLSHLLSRHLLTVCLALLLGACAFGDVGGDPFTSEPPVGKADDDGRSPAIFNGAPTAGHPAVGMLRMGSSGLCTATLVGKRTVLTAAHCTRDYVAPSAYTVYFNNQPYAVAARIPNPHFSWAQDGKLDPTKHALDDIAVLRLFQAPPVQPSPVAATPPQVGQPLTLVGFGFTDVGKQDGGIKRAAQSAVEQVHGGFIAFGSKKLNNGSIRPGDSGGPAFFSAGGQLAQIGVASMFMNQSGVGISCRVDRHINWLKLVSGGDLVVLGQPSAPGPTPPGPTPPLPQGQGFGQHCADHVQCQSHLCATFAGSNYCTLSCDPLAPQACPGGAGCYPTAQGLWICGPPNNGGPGGGAPPPAPPPQNNKGGYGQPCSSTADCQSQVCISINGSAFCSKTCASSGACPAGHSCRASYGFSFCAP